MGVFRLIKKPLFHLTKEFLDREAELGNTGIRDIANDVGERGVDLLSSVTPIDTGKTAESWDYRVRENKDHVTSLEFHNDNVNDDVKIALLLQYGHATRDGKFVEGRDYLNEPQKNMFNEMVDTIWRKVSRG